MLRMLILPPSVDNRLPFEDTFRLIHLVGLLCTHRISRHAVVKGTSHPFVGHHGVDFGEARGGLETLFSPSDSAFHLQLEVRRVYHHSFVVSGVAFVPLSRSESGAGQFVGYLLLSFSSPSHVEDVTLDEASDVRGKFLPGLKVSLDALVSAFCSGVASVVRVSGISCSGGGSAGRGGLVFLNRSAGRGDLVFLNRSGGMASVGSRSRSGVATDRRWTNAGDVGSGSRSGGVASVGRTRRSDGVASVGRDSSLALSDQGRVPLDSTLENGNVRLVLLSESLLLVCFSFVLGTRGMGNLSGLSVSSGLLGVSSDKLLVHHHGVLEDLLLSHPFREFSLLSNLGSGLSSDLGGLSLGSGLGSDDGISFSLGSSDLGGLGSGLSLGSDDGISFSLGSSGLGLGLFSSFILGSGFSSGLGSGLSSDLGGLGSGLSLGSSTFISFSDQATEPSALLREILDLMLNLLNFIFRLFDEAIV